MTPWKKFVPRYFRQKLEGVVSVRPTGMRLPTRADLGRGGALFPLNSGEKKKWKKWKNGKNGNYHFSLRKEG